jgi:hypothetical protein
MSCRERNIWPAKKSRKNPVGNPVPLHISLAAMEEVHTDGRAAEMRARHE